MFPFFVDAAYLSWHSSWWHMKGNALKWEWKQWSQNSCFSSSSSQFLRIADQWIVGTLREHWQKQIEVRAQVDPENELPPIFTIFVNLIARAWFTCKHNAKSFEQNEFKGIQHNQHCFVFLSSDLDNDLRVYICALAKFCNFDSQENLFTAEKE